jgi:hypothetical protein
VERLLVGFPHSLVVERSYLLVLNHHSVSFAASWRGLGFKKANALAFLFTGVLVTPVNSPNLLPYPCG